MLIAATVREDATALDRDAALAAHTSIDPVAPETAIWTDQGQPRLERNITTPVIASAQAKTRLRLSAAMRWARRAPNQAATACAGAMQAHLDRLIEPISAACEGAEANAATSVCR